MTASVPRHAASRSLTRDSAHPVVAASSRSPMAARERSPRRFTHAHRQRLDRAAEHYLRDCFKKATRATVAEFANYLGCHPDYLTRTAGSILGASLLEFLRTKQMEEAERLIRVTTLSIADIAVRAGFGTVSTFYRRFRESHAMSPGAFRQVRK